MPGKTIDALFLDTMVQSSGRIRLALVQSVGNRRITAAVPALTDRLKDNDDATARAAIKALGQIGTEPALAALRHVPDATAPDVVDAMLACARRRPTTEAGAIYREVLDNRTVPVRFRVAAYLALLVLEPASAPAHIVDALSGDDLAFKRAAIAALGGLPAKTIVPVLTDRFKTWNAPTQAMVVTALGRTGDQAATPLVSDAARSEDAAVHQAAIVALGALPGNQEIALLLAREAATNGEMAKLARQSLSTLRGSGVSETIVAGATHVGDPLRAVFIEQLGLRNEPEALSILKGIRNDPDVKARVASLSALTLVAPATEEPALVEWTVAAKDGTEQSRAMRALVSAASQNPDANARLRPITDAIEKASPAIQLRLLTALSRLGGEAAANYVAQFALRKEAVGANAAITTLGHWSDASGLAALATVAEKATDDAVRDSAVKTAAQAIEDSGERRTSEQKTVIKRLFAATQDEEMKKRLTALQSPH